MTAATGEDVDVAELLEAVAEDPDLTPAEKETVIGFGKPDDVARVYTAEAGLARRLLAHPHTEIRTLNVLDGHGERESVPPEAYAGGRVVGVVLGVPVGALQVKSAPRQTTQHAEIVSKRVLDDVGGESDG